MAALRTADGAGAERPGLAALGQGIWSGWSIIRRCLVCVRKSSMRRPFRCSREIGRTRGASDFIRQNCGLYSDDSRVGRFWRSAPKPGSDDRLASAELPPSPPSSVLGRFPSHPARRRSEPARAEDAAGSRASKLPGRRPTCRRAVGNRTPDLSVLLAKLRRANPSARRFRIRPNPTRWPVGSSRWGGRSSEWPDG